MNIALIGTPGSGKTDLAEALQRELGQAIIIDGYAPQVEGYTQIALGSQADYLGNLYVALERYAQERVARLGIGGTEHVITCGTLIETAVYLAMHFTALANTLDEAGKAEAAPRIDAVLRMFSVLYNDIMDYDRAFYLPGVKGDADTRFMDQQLQAGLEGFKLIQVTTLATRETQLEDALEALEVHAA